MPYTSCCHSVASAAASFCHYLRYPQSHSCNRLHSAMPLACWTRYRAHIVRRLARRWKAHRLPIRSHSKLSQGFVKGWSFLHRSAIGRRRNAPWRAQPVDVQVEPVAAAAWVSVRCRHFSRQHGDGHAFDENAPANEFFQHRLQNGSSTRWSCSIVERLRTRRPRPISTKLSTRRWPSRTNAMLSIAWSSVLVSGQYSRPLPPFASHDERQIASIY